jgi:hypothetical protein
MAINLQDLEQHLQRRQWRYQVVTEQQAILTGMVGKNIPQLAIALQLSEDGECLQFQAPRLLSIKDSVFKGVAFQTLLALNHQIKLLSFEYDPIDGEVRGVIELPIEDTGLSAQQFDRCLDQLVTMVDRVAIPRLREVLATGNDPGWKGIGQLLAEELSPDAIALLRELFHAIQP